MPLKHWTPGCCCGEGTPTDCGLFYDDFVRTDSESIGNGWGESGVYQIADFNLEGFSGDAWAPLPGGPNISINSVVRFTDSTQIAKIYYGGPGYYVAITPTSTSSTTRNFWLVFNGAVVDRDSASFPLLQFTPVSICITSQRIAAWAASKSVTHTESSFGFTGSVGVGVSGNTGNGPVLFDLFTVDVSGGDCFNCSPVGCDECSPGSQWMIDLTSWSGQMTSAINPFGSLPPEFNCNECPTWGQYILDPVESDDSNQCLWTYIEEFCPGFDELDDGGRCGPVLLTITLRARFPSIFDRDAPPCGLDLSVTLAEAGDPSGGAGCFDFGQLEQTVSYSAGAFSGSTLGSGVAVMHKYLGNPQGEYFRSLDLFRGFPICVENVIVTGPGTVSYEYWSPPETITVTRL